MIHENKTTMDLNNSVSLKYHPPRAKTISVEKECAAFINKNSILEKFKKLADKNKPKIKTPIAISHPFGISEEPNNFMKSLKVKKINNSVLEIKKRKYENNLSQDNKADIFHNTKYHTISLQNPSFTPRRS